MRRVKIVLNGLIIAMLCFFSISLFAQVEIPRGKSGSDYVNEAKRYVSGISPVEAKEIYDRDKTTVFVDVRPYTEYAKYGYLFRRLDLPAGRLIFDARFRIPHKDTPIIVYAKKGKRAAIAAAQLVQMGYTNVRYMEGGILAWKRAGYPVMHSSFVGTIDMPRGKTPEEFLKETEAVAGEGITPLEAKERIERDSNTVILDVATRREYAIIGGKIPSSIVTSYGEIVFTDFMKKVVPDANIPIIVTCTTGKRGLQIAKVLKEMGYKNVTYIRGGLGAWKKAGLPLEKYEPTQERKIKPLNLLQVEPPQGKTGEDFANEAKRYVRGISLIEAKKKFDNKEAIFVDVRRRSEYKSGFIEGSLDIPLGRLIFDARERIPNKNTPIITYCEKGMRGAIAGSYFVQMGYTNVRYLEGGISAWKKAGYPVVISPYYYKIDLPQGKTPEEFLKEAEAVAGEGITPLEAKRRMDRDPNTVILDVSTPIEHTLLGKIEGSLLLEQGEVPFNIKKKVHDARTPIIVTCSTGKRAILVAKVLKEMGYKNVTYIRGGLGAWKKAGLPTATYIKGEEEL
ncbi:MAG: hypothetical protein B6D55_07520 [Candidatus Omnitrophica bacterium 4484_70.2]|nr:MAG: hypothetical protein B6D55_07520 [Candidatus Omnitrophica bacterium 4484_70.2]